MTNTALATIGIYFDHVHDPRVDRCRKFLLKDILFLSLTAVLCGANDFVAIEEFGNASIDFFSKYIDTTAGIPSHDTIGRIFNAIDPKQFQSCFLSWISNIVKSTKGKFVAIDGKTVRGISNPIHIINVWVAANSVVFSQLSVNSKQNEITAINTLLDILDLTGAVITIDAIACQHAIVDKISKHKADYVLAVKNNQKSLFSAIKSFFDDTSNLNKKLVDVAETTQKSRDRFERRICTVSSDKAIIGYINEDGTVWTGLNTIIKTESIIKRGDKKTTEERFFISSLKESADFFASAIKGHWSIENNLHWVLDIAFREDDTRVQGRNAIANLSWLRKMVLSLLKQDTSKGSIKGKRNRAGWNEKFRESMLSLLFGYRLG